MFATPLLPPAVVGVRRDRGAGAAAPQPQQLPPHGTGGGGAVHAAQPRPHDPGLCQAPGEAAHPTPLLSLLHTAPVEGTVGGCMLHVNASDAAWHSGPSGRRRHTLHEHPVSPHFAHSFTPTLPRPMRLQATLFSGMDRARMDIWEALDKLNELREYEAALMAGSADVRVVV